MDDGLVVIQWNLPKYTGSSPITGYHIDACESGSTSWIRFLTVDKNVTNATIKNLKTDCLYFLRVFAVNEVGVSAKSIELYDPICARKARSKVFKNLLTISTNISKKQLSKFTHDILYYNEAAIKNFIHNEHQIFRNAKPSFKLES